MTINLEALKEDLRKLGVVLIGGGLIAILLNTPPIAMYEALYSIGVGAILYIAGLVNKGESK